MKILGRIKKSKVLTAVMTAVLIFQSACPTGLAYAAQKSGVSAYAAGQTIDQALGATKTVESVLSQHENDEYYLTTPYGNKGPHGEGGAIDTWDCWKPKGEYGSGAYMNCTGFVVAVLRACGANTSIIGNYTAKDGYNRGNETNASKWDEYCRDNNAVSYTFSSKEQMDMLSSFGYRANHAKYTHALAVVARFPPFDHLAYSEAERDKKTPEVYQ